MIEKDDKIIIGISSCLLGEKVRHDGGHKKSSYLLNILSPHAEFKPCCPEVGIGLGVPRPAIRLKGDPHNPRLIFVQDESKDITDRMLTFSTKKAKEMNELDGYILKKDSPSCGMTKVRVYQEPAKSPKMGIGLFAKVLMDTHPNLPMEDEGRLNDVMLRENFLERVFVYKKLKKLAQKPTKGNIVEFHATHKYALMAHSNEAYRKIGQKVSNLKNQTMKQFIIEYTDDMMKAFKLVATRKKQTNVLQHIYGYIKKLITDIDRQEMCEVIEQYRMGLLPLIVPITLLKHHINHNQLDYIKNQVYLYPYPDELMLRNAI